MKEIILFYGFEVVPKEGQKSTFSETWQRLHGASKMQG